MRGTLLEHLYEISRDMHEVGLLSDEELRESDLNCRPRRARWRVRLGDALDGWVTVTHGFFIWDLFWQRRVRIFLKKRLRGLRNRLIALWHGQTDNREALSHE